jgi:hypothetical protein
MPEDNGFRAIFGQHRTYDEAREQLMGEFGDLAPWAWDSALACKRLEVVGLNNRLNQKQQDYLRATIVAVEHLFTELAAEHRERLFYRKLFSAASADEQAALARYDELVTSIQGLVETHIKPLLEDTGETADAS